MVTSEPLTQVPLSGAFHAAAPLAPDADFDTRWAAWVDRGRLHEQRVRRKAAVWAGVLTMGAAVVYALFRS